MRAIIFRRGSCSIGGSNFSGGTLTNPLILAGDPTQPLEAATKQYVDNGLAALNANNLTSGTVLVARLPAFTGDITSNSGTNTLTLTNTGVNAGTYTKVTVDAKGRVTSGGALADSDIPNLDWSKITTGKPTTLSGYGITDGVNKSGDSMTGPLTLSGNATSPLHAVPLQQLSEVASGSSGVEFIASGNIPSAGLTVGLNANGTVSVITGDGQPESWGSPTYNNLTMSISAVYDSANQKVVIAYSDHGEGYAIVGTVSGNSISFGLPVFFGTVTTSRVSTVYDPVNQKVVIIYDAWNSGIQNCAIVGAVSGTSISFGAPVVFGSYDIDFISTTYDSANNKIVIAYSVNGNPQNSYAIVSTVLGNSVSFGTPVIFSNVATYSISAVYDSANQKVVIAYSSASQGHAIVGTVSGNNISFGTPVNFNNVAIYNVYNISATYNSANQKVVIAYSSGSQGRVILGTVSGNSISFSTPVVFYNGVILDISAIYIPVNNKVLIAYTMHTSGRYGAAIIGTVLGNNVSFGSQVILGSGDYFDINISAVYDSSNNKIVVAYSDFAIVYTPDISAANKNTFIGISQNSATNGAAVRVKVKGQVDSNQSGLTPGQLYYVSDNGTLTTTSTNNPLAGVAISATKLLITNWSIS